MGLLNFHDARYAPEYKGQKLPKGIHYDKHQERYTHTELIPLVCRWMILLAFVAIGLMAGMIAVIHV